MRRVADDSRGGALLRRALTGDDDSEPRGHSAIACAIGAIFVAAVLAMLEWRWPLYFTQDDNFSALPVTIASCRGLLQGVFPQWNPLQYLGQPTSVQSIFALTYPFTWVSYFLARALGGDYLFVEVFSLLHFGGTYFASFAAGRAMRLRAGWAMVAAVATVLSGTALMIGRSYAQMTPVLLWMALLVVLVERLRRDGGSTRWVVTFGLLLGFFCHCGNAQMWIYGVLFAYLAIALLAMTRRIAPGDLLWSIAAGTIGLGLSLPLAIPQMWFMQDVARSGGSGNGIAPYLRALFVPLPLADAPHPQLWGNSPDMTTFYYDGTLLTVVAFAALLGTLWLVFARRLRDGELIDLIGRNVWLVVAAIAFLIALGPEGLLWRSMSVLPVFDKFTGPWKLLLFFHFFAAIAASLVLQRLRKPRLLIPIALTLMTLLAYNAWHARGAFYNFADRPYPPLPRQLQELLTSGPESTRGRILAMAALRNGNPGYAQSLMHALPSYYGVASFDGYDPFTSATVENLGAQRFAEHDPIGACRAYGVRWIIVHTTAFSRRTRWTDPTIDSSEFLDPLRQEMLPHLLAGAKLRLSLPDIEVGEVPDVDPLAFPAGARERPLAIALDQAGATVDVRPLANGGRVVVNVLLRRGIKAFVDGQSADLTTDQYGRVVVNVHRGATLLRVAYMPPWRAAIGTGSAVALLGLLGCFVLSRRQQAGLQQ
jgi:hypothetical protein